MVNDKVIPPKAYATPSTATAPVGANGMSSDPSETVMLYVVESMMCTVETATTGGPESHEYPPRTNRFPVFARTTRVTECAGATCIVRVNIQNVRIHIVYTYGTALDSGCR